MLLAVTTSRLFKHRRAWIATLTVLLAVVSLWLLAGGAAGARSIAIEQPVAAPVFAEIDASATGPALVGRSAVTEGCLNRSATAGAAGNCATASAGVPAPANQSGVVPPPPPEISGGGVMGGEGVRVPEGGESGDRASRLLEIGSAYAPGVINEFDGPNFDDNRAETGGFAFIPPDPIAAAGPAHVVAVVNVMIEWRSKAGTLQFRDALLDFFAPLSPANFTFDPKVIYDQYAGRFVVVTLERVFSELNPDPGNTSRILLAVSDDADPNGAWSFHAINAKTVVAGIEHWADYPGFAVDDQAVYITNNMFAFPGGTTVRGVRLWIVDKGLGTGGFYDGEPASVTVHDPYAVDGIPMTTQPAHMFGTGPAGVGTFLVGYSGLTDGGEAASEFLQVIRLDDPVGTPIFTHQLVDAGDLEDLGGAFGFPSLPDAPQSGSAVGIEVNDRRALNAVWRDDALWATATIMPNAGPDAGQTTAHWFKLYTSNLGAIVVADQGDVGGEDIAAGTFTFFPSLAVNSRGDMAIGFAASAPTIFPSAAYTGRLASDPAGTVQPSEVYRPGADFYVRTFSGSRNRWGDYSGMSVDPSDDLTFWVFNEYAQTRDSTSSGGDGRWATRYASFAFDATPPELQSATVDGATMVLTYNEALNSASDPAPGDFVINTSGAGQTVSAADADGTTVTLTLNPGVAAGDTVSINYTASISGGATIEDLAGNDAADLVNQPVANNTAETMPPELQSATVDGETLVLTYNEVLNSASDPAAGAFVINTSGAAQTVSAADADGTTVTLTLNPGVAAGDTVSINYTAANAGGAPIEDLAGNAAADLVDKPVTNNTAVVAIRGDCNGDEKVDAGDITALVLEIFDGDGTNPADVPGGAFPGDPVGCDANEDATVDAGDITCIILIIFGGPGACGTGTGSLTQGGQPGHSDPAGQPAGSQQALELTAL